MKRHHGWNFECKSHSWIKNNEIKWSEEEIRAGRNQDEKLKKEYYQPIDISATDTEKNNNSIDLKTKFWNVIKRLFSK